MLLLAFSYRRLLYQPNKTIIFFRPKTEKEKKKAKGEKKDMQVKSNAAAAVKVFWEKYYLQGGDFFQKPAGLDLYCR
jgi:hypothetical protein